MRARTVLMLTALIAVSLLSGGSAEASRAKPEPADMEGYLPEPMPPGFRVLVNELEGPAFADASGKTLYKWPLRGLRNGSIGDRKDAPSSCTPEVTRVNSGFMSIYPPGLLLPDLATRKSCQEVWPPVPAAQ